MSRKDNNVHNKTSHYLRSLWLFPEGNRQKKKSQIKQKTSERALKGTVLRRWGSLRSHSHFLWGDLIFVRNCIVWNYTSQNKSSTCSVPSGEGQSLCHHGNQTFRSWPLRWLLFVVIFPAGSCPCKEHSLGTWHHEICPEISVDFVKLRMSICHGPCSHFLEPSNYDGLTDSGKEQCVGDTDCFCSL